MAEFSSKKRVYHALIIRFIIGRYGRENIGFMWTIVEPTMLCVGVMLIWSFTKDSGHHGINIVAFVFTGYMPLTLWRHLTGYMVNICSHTKFLTVYHNVTVFDSMISRLTLEFLSVTSASIVVFLFLFALRFVAAPSDPGLMLQGWLLMAALSSGAGLMIASLSILSHVVEKLNQPLQYFILPISGCFFLVDWLPDNIKTYALWVPHVHAYEIIRHGFYGEAINTYGDPYYVLFAALVMAGGGLFIFERVKDRIEG